MAPLVAQTKGSPPTPFQEPVENSFPLNPRSNRPTENIPAVFTNGWLCEPIRGHFRRQNPLCAEGWGLKTRESFARLSFLTRDAASIVPG